MHSACDWRSPDSDLVLGHVSEGQDLIQTAKQKSTTVLAMFDVNPRLRVIPGLSHFSEPIHKSSISVTTSTLDAYLVKFQGYIRNPNSIFLCKTLTMQPKLQSALSQEGIEKDER
jgi:hypothetical protein